jgi:hypothetical protein
LKQGVARQQCHFFQFTHIPGAYQDAARIRIAAQLLHHLSELIDVASVGGRPISPLLAIHGAEFALLVRPFVPDADVMIAQIFDVGVAAQEPQKLINDRPQVQLLGGHQRKAILKVEAHLITEHAQRAGSGAIALGGAVQPDVAQEVEILPHQAFTAAKLPLPWCRQ